MAGAAADTASAAGTAIAVDMQAAGLMLAERADLAAVWRAETLALEAVVLAADRLAATAVAEMPVADSASAVP